MAIKTRFQMSIDLDKYMDRMAKLGDKTVDCCKYSVYEAAGMVKDAIKANCPKSDGKHNKKHLVDSIYLKEFAVENGYVFTQVGYDGYDDNGVPQALKARSLESGHSSPKGVTGRHTFVRPALTAVRAAATKSIQDKLDEYLTNFFKE